LCRASDDPPETVERSQEEEREEMKLAESTAATANQSRISLARKAVKAFPRTEFSNREDVKRHRIKWMASVEHLGPHWLGLPIVLPRSTS